MEKRGTSDERLAAICQTIRKDTLEPAQQEAEQIKQIAEREAARVRAEAKQQADRMLHEARRQLKEEREAFEVSLEQASRQAIGVLKEKIEKTLFNPALDYYLSEEFRNEPETAKLLSLIIDQISAQGLSGDLSVWIGSHLSKEALVQHLGKEVLSKLPKEGLHVGDQAYGLSVKILNRHLSIEISPETVREVLADFLRSDFRSFLFSE